MSNPAYQNYLTELQNFVNAIGQASAQDKSDSYSGPRDSNGQPNGYGKMIYADGSVYEGQFIRGVKNGVGKSWDSNGKLTGDGVWEKDEIKDGLGIFEYEDGQQYEGEIKSRLRHGKGINIWPDGAKYEGYFKNGCRDGKGRYELTDGNFYEGEWMDGKKNGNGIYLWADGNRYDGGWHDDKRTGKGIYIWPNGDQYHGDWENGNMNGEGTLIYADGRRYDGEWHDDKRTGKGILIYANGDKFEGAFKEGVRDGMGLLLEKNGNKYEGEWKNDKENGKGSKTWQDENWKADGIFKNGYFYKGIKVLIPSGSKLEGVFDEEGYLINGKSFQNSSTDGHEIEVIDGCYYFGRCWDKNGSFEGYFYTSVRFVDAGIKDGVSNGYNGIFGNISDGWLQGQGIITDESSSFLFGGHYEGYEGYGDIKKIEGYFTESQPNGDCWVTFQNGVTVKGIGNGSCSVGIYSE